MSVIGIFLILIYTFYRKKRKHGLDLLNRDFVVLGIFIYMLGVCMKCMAMHPEASALAPTEYQCTKNETVIIILFNKFTINI
jgi:hypothetical protein